MGGLHLEAESYSNFLLFLPKNVCILELIALSNDVFNIMSTWYGIFVLTTRHMGTLSANFLREVRHQMPFPSILVHWLVWYRASFYFTCNKSAQNDAEGQGKHAVDVRRDENEVLQEECQ